jgi:hybrid cluster-associated redox disulfide protein
MFGKTVSDNTENNTGAPEEELSTVSAAIAAEKAKQAAAENGSAEESAEGAESASDKYKDIPVDEDGIYQFISKDMLVGDVIEIYPQAAKAFLSVGMHCVTCGVALYESVEEASYVHGLDPDDVIKVVNDILTTELIEHPGESGVV